MRFFNLFIPSWPSFDLNLKILIVILKLLKTLVLLLPLRKFFLLFHLQQLMREFCLFWICFSQQFFNVKSLRKQQIFQGWEELRLSPKVKLNWNYRASQNQKLSEPKVYISKSYFPKSVLDHVIWQVIIRDNEDGDKNHK